MDLAGRVSKAMRALREQKGLTQTELSRLSRVPKETISKNELGRPPRLQTLDKVMRAMDVSVYDLFAFDLHDPINENRAEVYARCMAIIATLPDDKLRLAEHLLRAAHAYADDTDPPIKSANDD